MQLFLFQEANKEAHEQLMSAIGALSLHDCSCASGQASEAASAAASMSSSEPSEEQHVHAHEVLGDSMEDAVVDATASRADIQV